MRGKPFKVTKVSKVFKVFNDNLEERCTLSAVRCTLSVVLYNHRLSRCCQKAGYDLLTTSG